MSTLQFAGYDIPSWAVVLVVMLVRMLLTYHRLGKQKDKGDPWAGNLGKVR